jgi:Alanine-zipper, major outer membrane lipoprotein
MRSTLDSTNRAVQGAEAAANRASSKADQALELAQANKASIDATNEKIDRMFRRHLSK